MEYIAILLFLYIIYRIWEITSKPEVAHIDYDEGMVEDFQLEEQS